MFSSIVGTFSVWCLLAAPLAAVCFVILYLLLRLLLGLVRYQLVRSRYSALPNGPLLLPYLGATNGFEDMLRAMPRNADGSLVGVVKTGFFADGAHMVTVQDAEAFKAILSNTTDFPKYPPQYDGSGAFFGYEQMGNIYGARHRHQRRIITPVFHFERLRVLSPILVQFTRDCIEQLRKQLRHAPGDKQPCTDKLSVEFLNRLTMRAIIAAAFGSQLDLDWMANRYSKMTPLFKIHIMSYMALGSIVDRVPWLFPATAGIMIMRRGVLKRLTQLATNRMEQLHQQAQDSNKPEVRDLLTALLTAVDTDGRAALTPAEVIDNCFMFLGAGQETASFLQWFLYFVCTHPDVQDKVHAEVDQALTPSFLSKSTDDQLAECALNLPYLNAVVSEVLRLRPPVPFTTRLVTRDVELAGHRIPKGTCLGLNFYGLHRNSKYWENPDSFQPDRFLKQQHGTDDEAKQAGRVPYSYLAFSAGTHSCVGMNFARKEITIVAALLMKAFSVELAVDKPEDVHGTIRAALAPSKLSVRFTARE